MNEADSNILERYGVNLNQRLEPMDSAGARAVAAERSDVYALAHKRSVPARIDLIADLMASPSDHLLNPVDKGIAEVETPEGPGECRITIVEAPTGRSLTGDWRHKGRSADRFVKETLVRGAVAALQHLYDLGYTHRAIRPDNIFHSSDPQIGIVLGDCFSAPPGSGQTNAYEPIERSIADPASRGDGDEAADMFALGVTLLELYTGKTAGEGRSPQELYHARIAQGSFWAYAGGRDLPGSIAGLLRNLLNDDPAERWTLADLKLWSEGQTPRKLSGFSNWSTSRPVMFMGQSFSDRRLLAEVFSANPAEAATFLRRREYPAWIQQVVSTENLSDRLERLLQPKLDEQQESAPGTDEALIAKYCMFMDPFGPVRYYGMAFPLDGVGQVLADAFARNDTVRIDAITRLFSSKLLNQLIEIAEEHNPLAAEAMHELGPAVRVMQSNVAGLGIERMLYDLNPGLPCQGGQTSGLWSDSVGDALRVLELSQESAVQGGELFDKHFMAFCSSRDNGLEAVFSGLGRTAGDPTRAALATADIIAHLQAKSKAGPLPALCGRLASRLKPLIDSLKNRRRRENARARLADLVADGDAARISSGLNLAKLQALDNKEYNAAVARYAGLKQARSHLEKGVHASDPAAENFGYQAAAAVGVLVLGLSSAMFLWGL